MYTCCFIGDENIWKIDEVKKSLSEILEKLIDKGYDQFLFNGKGDFDAIAFDEAKKYKQKGAKIKLIYCFDCYKKDILNTENVDILKYDEYRLLKFFNEKNSQYHKYCAMIDTSDFTAACVRGSELCVETKALLYAISNDRPYTNLYKS